jgi:hypothetical protein
MSSKLKPSALNFDDYLGSTKGKEFLEDFYLAESNAAQSVESQPMFACNLFLALAYSSTLKMEATFSSETSVDFQPTTRRYIPEDRTFQCHRCENLKSYKKLIGRRNNHQPFDR